MAGSRRATASRDAAGQLAIDHLTLKLYKGTRLRQPHRCQRNSSVSAIKTQKGQSPKPSRRTLSVPLDDASRAVVSRAAELRRVSTSDFVREVAVAQAKHEVSAARRQVIALSPDEQLQFWKALNATPKLTAAQKQLGRLMRGGK